MPVCRLDLDIEGQAFLFVIRHILVVAFVLTTPPVVAAQVVPDTVVALSGITVTATRAAATPAVAPARMTVLDAAAGASVADLLEARAGAFLRRYGPSGLSSLSLRGTGASQTLVLLDGHRLTDPQLGQLDLSLLPTVLLSSVEVVHGAGSALYGTDAVGGVVNLRALQAGARPRVRTLAHYGAYGERMGEVALTGRRGAWSGVVAGAYRSLQGDYPYLNPALFPPREVRREGAAAVQVSLYGRAAYEGGRHAASVAVWFSDADRGLPGPATSTPKGERQGDRLFRVWGEDRLRVSGGSVRLSGAVQAAHLRYQNPSLRLDDTGRTLTASAEAEWLRTYGAQWLVGLGLSGSYGQARHPSLRADAREQHGAAFAHATATLGHLHLYPALRLDAYAFSDGIRRAALSPRLGVNLQLPWPVLRLKASLGRAFRTPTFNDRFWQPGGNPDLNPETAWTYDAGLRLHRATAHHAFSAEVTAFRHHIRDQIVWQPMGVFWAPDNVGQVRTQGVEASTHLRLRPGPHLDVEATALYTYTDATDRTTPGTRTYGQPLRYVPPHQAKATLGVGWRRVRAEASWHHTGRRFVTSDGTQWLPPYHALTAQVSLQHTVFHTRFTLTGGLDNATDQTYEVIKGYPMPPRTFFVRLHARWQGRE